MAKPVGWLQDVDRLATTSRSVDPESLASRIPGMKLANPPPELSCFSSSWPTSPSAQHNWWFGGSMSRDRTHLLNRPKHDRGRTEYDNKSRKHGTLKQCTAAVARTDPHFQANGWCVEHLGETGSVGRPDDMELRSMWHSVLSLWPPLEPQQRAPP